MKAIWTGTIGFGLVNIPVKMYSAAKDRHLDLEMLDKSNQAHIRYKKINDITGEEVPAADVVKGYKYDNAYVLLNEVDFELASAVKTKTIGLIEFVDEAEIDTLYYDKPYYLEPAPEGEKAYLLLREALKHVGKVGVATYVLRNKEYLALLKPMDDLIILNRLRFKEEILSPPNLILSKLTSLGKHELDAAVQIIKKYSGHFDIAHFKDTYNTDLLRIIEAKAKGKRIKRQTIHIEPTKTEELLAKLRASVALKKKQREI